MSRRGRGGFAGRYWGSLVGAHATTAGPTRRARAGYSLRQRYLAALLDIPLPVRTTSARRPAPRREPARRHSARPSTLPLSELGRFLLPRPAARGAVTAAGSSSEAILRAREPDGSAEFLLHRSASAKAVYHLECVLRAAEPLPAIITVWYQREYDGQEQALFIPIARSSLGPPSSTVRLPGFAPDGPWYASSPVPPGRVEVWEPEVLRRSIAVAANEGTITAWRSVAELVDAEVGELILAALR
jgi:hypothetical protein